MDWNAISQALTEAAKTADHLNAIEFVPDALPNTATFYVGEIDVDLDLTFRRAGRRGTDKATITCRVLVAKADDKHSLRKMRDYMGGSGPKSLVEAISADRTLAGTVHDSQVKRMRGNRLFIVGDKRYYGVEIDIFVIGDA